VSEGCPLKAVARVAALVGVLSTLVILPPAQSALGAGFGSDPLPASHEECTNGGWRRFGVFKSQGDCVSFVATRGKNPPAFEPSPPQAIFAPPVHYGAGSGSELALGDFNGDTETDVVVYDGALGNDVSLLLNNGDGTFADPVSLGVANVRGTAVGDFDGDSDPDLAVTKSFPASVVSVLLNNGDGTFAAAVDYGTGGDDPLGVAVGDLDGDTHPDLAVANDLSTNVSVLLNDGDGTFADPVGYEVGENPLWLAVGDFDGDADADLAVTKTVPAVAVLLNNGDGTFAVAANYGVSIGFAAPWKVAIGDFDGDTAPDLAVSNPDANTASVLLNNGDGTFATAVNYGVGDGPFGIAVGDFNGDADPDIAVGNTRSNNVSVLLNNGDGTFVAAVNIDLDVSGSGMAVEDFNGDAKPDLAVTTESALVAVLLHV
jgi:FG-GAP-like repeat